MKLTEGIGAKHGRDILKPSTVIVEVDELYLDDDGKDKKEYKVKL